MSVKLVSQEIERFLESPEPDVFCIMGEWGVGKTYAWNQYLQKSISENIIGLKSYSYVSVFGQNSLEDLKYSIFQNTVSVNDILNEPDVASFKSGVKSAISFAKTVPSLGEGWAQSKPYLTMLSRAFFLAVRNQIVCIDDLERVGKGLDILDVLGLVSFLKERRRCKVVLLLNEGELSDDQKQVFKDQLEKVIDVEMRFEPTEAEAVDIGVDKSLSFHETLASDCIKLGIVNIRVIRKIQRLAIRLKELLSDHDERVLQSALHALVLFGWIKYQPKLAPSIDFIRGFNPYSRLLGNAPQETDEQKSWRNILTSFGFSLFDEFDGLILDSVGQGYFDGEAIEKAATKADKDLNLQDQDSSFRTAWEAYHNSLNCDQEKVMDTLFEAFKRCVDSITPGNLAGTVGLFRDLGRNTEANEMIKYYIDKRTNESIEFWDIRHSVFLSDIQDPKIRDAFAKKLSSFSENERSVEDVLKMIYETSSWNIEDLSRLSQLSVDDYYSLFKSSSGDNLRAIIGGALKFSGAINVNEDVNTMTENAVHALKRIAGECEINKRRIKLWYGIEPDK